MTDEDESVNLIKERENIKKDIENLHKKISYQKDKIDELNKKIFNSCNHIWEKDIDSSPFAITKYYCIKCSLWRIKSMYV
jgi:predicted  nucleic acid-binding Zn-ribbon protein